ncbi:MAG: phosphoglycerate kinase [Clostridia bacterium]|nr:phosphoglycerate kinase [Clostridia bacterium]MBQ3927105.1 phosphoglycerate kinase [Clostridia bacterium]
MTYNKKTIEDVKVAGKKVLVRCDFNVPVKDGVITSEKRIVEALPTIKYLKSQGAMVILCSHMGKPHNVFDSKIKLNKKEVAAIEALPEAEREAATAAAVEKAAKDVKKFSLKVVADKLNELLGGGVVFATDTVGADAKAKVAAMKPGDIVLLENTRFTAKEEKNDPDFSKELGSLAELFVNDAFGTAHRAHASTAGVAQHAGLPAVCGYLIQKEIGIMGKALSNPERPFVAILGGAKVADKLNVINNLLTKVDTLIIGGGMAYTFLAAKGYGVGGSLLDESKLDYCKDMMKKAEERGVKLLLPVDTTVAKQFPDPIDAPIDVCVVDSDKIPADMQGLDIGDKTMALYADAVKNAKTVVWNGPMGVFENPTLAKGTIAVAKALAESSATTIVGGGDSAAACEQLGFADRITHISTGGGASLEFLEGLELPGIACLEDK